jgi:hypothetical protein
MQAKPDQRHWASCWLDRRTGCALASRLRSVAPPRQCRLTRPLYHILRLERRIGLRLLLLPAVLRLLRPAPVGGQAAPGQHRRQRRRNRGDGAPCRPDPRALAHRAYLVAGRLGLCARGADRVVRTQRSRLSVRPRPQHPAGRRDRGRTRNYRRRARRAACRRGASRTSPGQRRDSWSRERRVVAKAEWTGREATPS